MVLESTTIFTYHQYNRSLSEFWTRVIFWGHHHKISAINVVHPKKCTLHCTGMRNTSMIILSSLLYPIYIQVISCISSIFCAEDLDVILSPLPWKRSCSRWENEDKQSDSWQLCTTVCRKMSCVDCVVFSVY